MNPQYLRRAMTVTALSFFVLASQVIAAFPSQVAPPVPAANDIQLFAGKWKALHKTSPILILELHIEKGALAGGIRVCSFTINTEDTGRVVEITDPTLSRSLPVRNLEVWGKSATFDWKDPDGDENHLKLELTEPDAGRLNWVGLPAGLKVEPMAVSKEIPGKP